jgi:hypothetical protein
LGGSGPVYGTWTPGNSVGGLQAVTGAAVANWSGQTEGPTGGLLGFADTPTMLLGAGHGGDLPNRNQVGFLQKNKLHEAGPIKALYGAGAVTLAADNSPVSWASPASTVVGTLPYGPLGNDNIDNMGAASIYGVWTLKYDDPQVNTAGATAAWLWSYADAANLVITPVMASGPASPIAIPAGNVTMSGGGIQSISLAGLSLGTGWQGAALLIAYPAGVGAVNVPATATAVVTSGIPTAINVVTPGSGYTSAPTVVLYGTAVSGTTVTHLYDYEYVAVTTPGTGPTEWDPTVTLNVTQPQGLWNLGNPWLVAPDVRTHGAASFSRTDGYAVDGGVLAELTTPTGRAPACLRFMDATGDAGGLTNIINPIDLSDGSRLFWPQNRSQFVHFPFARAVNTDPNNTTYAWSMTKAYGTQGWAVQGPDPAFTITGTLTQGSLLVTGVSNMGLLVGSAVAGMGVPAGTTVAAIECCCSGVVATGSAIVASVAGDIAYLSAGMAVDGTGIPAGTTIAAVDATRGQVTLSQAATTNAASFVATGAQFRLSAAATASGTQTLTITSPGSVTLPAGSRSFPANGVTSAVIELRSTVPHGLTSGYYANIAGTTSVPLTDAPNWIPGIISAGAYSIFVTGPYTIVFGIFAGGGTNSTITQTINSTTELAVDWYLYVSSPNQTYLLTYEAAAAACARIGCGYWLNLPHHASDATIQAIAARVAAQIGSTVPVVVELGNEIFTFNYMGTYFTALNALFSYLPAATSIFGTDSTTIAGSARESFHASIGHAHSVFEAAWTAAGMDPSRLVFSWSGQVGGATGLASLSMAQKMGRRVDHVHIAPYVALASEAPVVQALAPAGSTYAAAGSAPADAINAANLYYNAYSQPWWSEWALETRQCRAFGQPLDAANASDINAVATCTVASGQVQTPTVTSGGVGYIGTPTVLFSGGGGSGAAGTVVLSPTTVASAAVTAGGTGYTSAPTVTITGGGGSGATATATISGGAVTAITIASGGSGYTGTPTVNFSGGGGSGAAATALLATTSVASITLTNAGSNYTSAPTITFRGGGSLTSGTYTFYYTFVDQAGGYGVGNETTIGLSQSVNNVAVFAQDVPVALMPAWPSWAQALNWYVGLNTVPGVCTFYRQVPRSQYGTTYKVGSPVPFEIPIPAGYNPPPATNQAASHTPVIPTMSCYEGSLQNPVPGAVPLQYQLLHDTFAHPSAADLLHGYELTIQRGCSTLPNSGAALHSYHTFFSQEYGANRWIITHGTSQLPGDGLGHAYAGSSTYTATPNRYATIQGGYSVDAVAPDGHPHDQYNVSPYFKAFRDWNDVTSPALVQPSTPVVRPRRWFAGLSRSYARSGR